MSKKTPQQSLDVKTDHLESSASDAFLLHERGNTDLAEAIGHAYEIHRLQPHARDKEWLDAQITKWNAGIDAHNKVINDNDKLSEKDKKAQRRMKAEGRDGASQFTALVKFLFKFDKPKHASQVSKYATVLDWVDRLFTDDKAGLGMFGNVRDKIVAAGGLTQVVKEQRDFASDKDANDLSQTEVTAMEKAVINSGREALKALPPKASFDKGRAIAHEGMFLLIGRQNGNKIEVADVADASADDIDHFITNRRGVNTAEVDEGLELIGRVLALGKLVKEGKSKIPVNRGAANGNSKRDITRALTMRPTNAGHPELVVSAKRATASIVVHAIAKNGALTSPQQTVFMNTRDRRKFESLFADWQKRRLYDLAFDTEPTTKDGEDAKSLLKMVVSNKVLKDASEKPKTEAFYWSDISQSAEKPLDRAETFQSNFSAKVSVLLLEHVFETVLNPWSNMGQEKKRANQIITIRLDGKTLSFISVEAEPVEIEVETGNEDVFALHFRASDLYEVFDQLRSQPAEAFTFNGDDTGMLQILWEDELANYDVCLPMVTSDGTLNHKHFDKIRAT